ncbi:sporulation protein [Streptomyces sp. NPDC056716]|uniref:sporulation protein n=1 Tax=unclassified Streptomyces TaxID=2593676 RepID=UPI00367F7879
MAVSRFLKLVANGVNPPKVTTELADSRVRPGERLTARVMLEGGAADTVIERFAVELLVRFESHGEHEIRFLKTVAEHTFPSPFTLAAGDKRDEEVAFDLPWEMPLTHAGGQPLNGAYCAVRTELAVADAVDRGDLDEVQVHALPAQEAVLTAMTDIGFRRLEAEVKPGHAKSPLEAADWWAGLQTAGWWQEIEMRFPDWYPHGSTLELWLVTGADKVVVCPGQAAPLILGHDETTGRAALAARLDGHLRAQFGG